MFLDVLLWLCRYRFLHWEIAAGWQVRRREHKSRLPVVVSLCSAVLLPSPVPGNEAHLTSARSKRPGLVTRKQEVYKSSFSCTVEGTRGRVKAHKDTKSITPSSHGVGAVLRRQVPMTSGPHLLGHDAKQHRLRELRMCWLERGKLDKNVDGVFVVQR